MTVSDVKAAYMREWRRNNAGKLRAARRAWRARNPERVAAHQRAKYLRERPEAIERAKQWRLSNPERYALHLRSWGERNKERRREHSRLWRIRNRDKYVAHKATRRARERNATVVDFTLGEWLILQDEFGRRCAYCGDSKPLTRDHIQPLSQGGSHTYENIVPACRSCNCRKHARSLDKFMGELMQRYGSYIDGAQGNAADFGDSE